MFMIKKITAWILMALMTLSLAACSGNTAQSLEQTDSQTSEATGETEADETEADETDADSSDASDSSAAYTCKVSNAIAEDEDALVSTYADKFEQLTYTDEESGLSITFNLCLPEGYDANSSYPMVVFIADSSCAGSDATSSLTQGRGALVWATDEWQSEYPTIVAVPTYPETILDDHGSYTTTEYVELTKRFIDYMCEEYAVDTNRIYGTGQSMGCMTTLILASEYPDLYAACMFVDGQWDIGTLEGLESQTFVYFAAEDDTNAWNGAQEVMAMFDEDSVSYTYSQWDGTWSVDDLSSAAASTFTSDENQYFISWLTGTIDASTASSGSSMGGSMGGPEGGFSGPSNKAMGASSGMGSSSYHMASFDYAYNCISVMEWLFAQSK